MICKDEVDIQLVDSLYNNIICRKDVSVISPINFKSDEIIEQLNISESQNNSKIHEITDTISFNESSQLHNYNANNVYQKKKLTKKKLNHSNYN
jgi:hypothetical protein